MASQAFLAFSVSLLVHARALGRYLTFGSPLCLCIWLSLHLYLPGFSISHATDRDIRPLLLGLYHRLLLMDQLPILVFGLVLPWALYAVS